MLGHKLDQAAASVTESCQLLCARTGQQLEFPFAASDSTRNPCQVEEWGEEQAPKALGAAGDRGSPKPLPYQGRNSTDLPRLEKVRLHVAGVSPQSAPQREGTCPPPKRWTGLGRPPASTHPAITPITECPCNHLTRTRKGEKTPQDKERLYNPPSLSLGGEKGSPR